MALIVPNELPSGASKGENFLHQLISEKLTDDFYVWYEYNIAGELPSFTILSPNFGLLIIQINSCYPNQISETNKSQEAPNKSETAYIDKLKKYQILTYPDGKNQSKLVFPVGVSVVMSNITELQGRERNIYTSVNGLQIIYREQFLLWKNFSGEEFLERLKMIFDIKSTFPILTSDQIETIKGILYPEIVIQEVPASYNSVPDGFKLQPHSCVIKTLDYRQECIARAIGEGHRIVYGVAGSGKTLILLCRAKLLAKQNQKLRILILCYNISLACYLKSILDNYSQFQTIEVKHFHGWASTLCKKLRMGMPGLSVDYCDELIGRKVLEELAKLPRGKKWDAVLVDEAQTFFPNWLECCVAALKDPDNGNLMIVSDGNQSLYKRRGFTWKTVGVKAVGRTANKKFSLDKNYRNTKQILAAAWSIVSCIENEENKTGKDNEDGEFTFPIIKPQTANRQGSIPVLHIERTQEQEVAAAIREIQKFQQLGYTSSDIGVLYRMAGDRERKMLSYLNNQLTNQGISTYWVTENTGSEKKYSIDRPGIRIMSTLNALGLEFKVVLILWVQNWDFCIPARSEADAVTCRRLYVAMTRAQDILQIFGSGNSSLLEQLRGSGTFEIQLS